MREPFRKPKPEKISQRAGFLSRIRKYYSQHRNVTLTPAASEIKRQGVPAQSAPPLEPQTVSK